MIFERINRALTFAILAVGIVFLFQNCGSFEARSGLFNDSSLGKFACQTPEECEKQEQEASLIQKKLEPSVVNDCLNAPNVNACLFFKNPVATRGGSFPASVNNKTDLRSFQTMGVVVDPTSVDSKGCLKNSSYAVISNVKVTSTGLEGGSFCSADSNYKFSYLDDVNFQVSAVMAQHYLNFQKSFMKEWVGKWFAENQKVNVWSVVNDQRMANNAFFFADDSNGSSHIIMGVFDKQFISDLPAGAYQEAALSAEVYLHEAGHANVFHASEPIEDPKKNISCGGDGSAFCCSSAKGCYGAINEGLADYHSIMIFPDNPAVGEAIANHADGIPSGSLPRNYEKLSQLTPSEAFNASGQSARGEIHSMGLVWGSFWYEARIRAKSQIGNRGVRALDRTFSAHLLALAGDDDFISACKKVVTLARSIDGGVVQPLLANECARRGLQ